MAQSIGSHRTRRAGWFVHALAALVLAVGVSTVGSVFGSSLGSSPGGFGASAAGARSVQDVDAQDGDTDGSPDPDASEEGTEGNPVPWLIGIAVFALVGGTAYVVLKNRDEFDGTDADGS